MAGAARTVSPVAAFDLPMLPDKPLRQRKPGGDLGGHSRPFIAFDLRLHRHPLHGAELQLQFLCGLRPSLPMQIGPVVSRNLGEPLKMAQDDMVERRKAR